MTELKLKEYGSPQHGPHVCIVGGSPQLDIDAVRYVSSRSSGDTARQLHALLRQAGASSTLVLNQVGDADPTDVEIYRTRRELEAILGQRLADDPSQCIVMSAAINDFEPVEVCTEQDGLTATVVLGQKISSQMDSFRVQFERAPKLIDALVSMGHVGPLVGFKFEDKDSVIASAQSLQHRVNADYVLANSLCMRVQALVSRHGIQEFEDRASVVQALATALTEM